MADGSVNRDPQLREGNIIAIPVEDNAHLYRGTGICVNAAGYATPMGDDSGSMFVGVALEEVDNTLTGHAQGGKNVRVHCAGSAVFAKATAAQTDVGLEAYCSFDDTVVLAAGSTYRLMVGTIISIPDATHVRVQLKLAQNVLDSALYVYGVISLHVKLANLANGDIVTNWHAPFAGELVKFSAVVSDPATTAAKAADLNLEIATTNVTGGVLGLTSANMTPLGAAVDASTITGANTFAAGDHISVEASGVTAFVEGEIELLIGYRQLLQA